MVAAKIRSVTEHSVRGAAKIANVGSGKIGEATTILEYGKDLVDQVIDGTMPLNKAYEEAQRRKKELQSDEAQLARLQNRPVLVKAYVGNAAVILRIMRRITADVVVAGKIAQP